MPLTVEMGKADSEYHLALIAEGLMRAGVLEEHHYMGSFAGESALESAIIAGLSALTFTIGTHGAPGNLSLTFSDDIRAIDGGEYLETRRWSSRFIPDGAAETPVGCFAICCDSNPPRFSVGERVLAMEREMGAVAWDIYRMLINAFSGILAIASPMWAQEQIELTDEEYYADWNLLKDVPESAVQDGWQRKRINAMRIDSDWPEWMQRVAENALTLCSLSVLPRKMRQVKTRLPRSVNHRDYLDGAYSLMPLCIQWHPDDGIDRVMDDNNEATWQAEMTPACWMTCFDLSRTGREPGTLWWSIQSLIATLRSLGVAGDMLLSLSQDSRLINVLGERVRV